MNQLREPRNAKDSSYAPTSQPTQLETTHRDEIITPRTRTQHSFGNHNSHKLRRVTQV